MPRRLFGIFSCTTATALMLGRSGCASSRQIIATVKTLSRPNGLGNCAVRDRTVNVDVVAHMEVAYGIPMSFIKSTC